MDLSELNTIRASMGLSPLPAVKYRCTSPRGRVRVIESSDSIDTIPTEVAGYIAKGWDVLYEVARACYVTQRTPEGWAEYYLTAADISPYIDHPHTWDASMIPADILQAHFDLVKGGED